jgi:beta-N-acetylhexosaminidase
MPLAAIFDCEGPRASPEEKAFLKDADPWGFIVFARHCASAEDLRAHCDELRECVGREDAPILIDQEGGRVARMKPPTFPEYPPPSVFGALWRLDPKRAKEAARLAARLLARLVSDCGVSVNCAPMLDVPQPDADPAVIGDRALARRAEIVAALGAESLAGALEGGVLPVVKHMPGHGRALCDSHEALPRVSARLSDLRAVDFAPFKALNHAPIGMTAHVLYEALDAEHCATLSKTVIGDVIRGEIGFDGLLLGDDLKMKALGGALETRARNALEAGCDVVLCCNFSLDEKRAVMDGLRDLSGKAAARARAALALRRAPAPFDASSAYQNLCALLRPVWPQSSGGMV